MPFKQFVHTLNGSAQQLSTVFSAADKQATNKGPSIISLTLQPNSSNADKVWVGSSAVSTQAYAFRMEAAAAGIPPAPFVLELGQGQVSLDDLYVIGANGEKVHVGIFVE